MNYQKIILAGNAAGDALRRKSKKGKVYTTFSVAVSNGKERKVLFPVFIFGKRAGAVSRYITKGRQVLVEGRIEVGDNDRFIVVADRVLLGALAGEPKPAKNNR